MAKGKKKMTLTLERMGMDIPIDQMKDLDTDVPNYRTRACFTDKKGREVVADFGFFSNKPLRNNLHIYATYYADGIGRDYVYTLCKERRSLNYDFTKKGILKFVNKMTGLKYDSIEFV